MRRKSLITLWLMVMGVMLMIPLPSAWAQTTLTLVTTADGVTPKSWFEPGDTFFLDIMVADASGVAGCAFTLEYPSDTVLPPSIDAVGLSVDIQSPFPFTFNEDQTHRGNVSGAGRLALAGVAIHPNNGGPLYAAGPVSLFRLRLAVAEVASPGEIVFVLRPSELWNPAAGYGTDQNGDGIYDPELDEMGLADVLVGAVYNTQADWNDLSAAYPVLIGSTAGEMARTALHVVDPQRSATTLVLPPGYDHGTPKTWPIVLQGSNLGLRASGGGGFGYQWSVTGPVAVTGSTGSAFNFIAPEEGPFAGIYTVTVQDFATGESDQVHIKVPLALFAVDPELRSIMIIREDSTEDHPFLLTGAPEGTEFAVIFVLPDRAPVDDWHAFGSVDSEAFYFNADAEANIDFTVSTTVGADKAFRLRVEVVEDGTETPLTDAGLDTVDSEVVHLAPMIDGDTDATFRWGEVAVQVAPGMIEGSGHIEVKADLPVDPAGPYAGKSVMLVKIDIVDATINGPIQITLPFDTDGVSEGDFEASRVAVYHAADEATLVAGGPGVFRVPVEDLVLPVDYANGLVTFTVRSLSVFAVGGVEVDPVPPGDGDSGGETDPPSLPGDVDDGGEVDPVPPGDGDDGGEVDPVPPGGGDSGGEADPVPPGDGDSGGEVDPVPPGDGDSGGGGGGCFIDTMSGIFRGPATQ